MMVEHQTSRVNGAMLPNYQNRNVCLLGMAKDVDTNGTSFTLTSCDGKDVKINMQEPLSEYVAGLTEVHGQVDSRHNIQCHFYLTFPDEISKTFNMDMYNSAVELTARAPQHYQQGIVPPQQ